MSRHTPKPEAGYVRVNGKSISELVDLPITELKQFFDHLDLNEHDTQVARRILTEINSRIRFLIDVGLGYLTLNRLSNSLSGGESQRINSRLHSEAVLSAVSTFWMNRVSVCTVVIPTV